MKKRPFIESVYNAKFKNVPSNYKALSAREIKEVNENPHDSNYMPQQEKGIRPSCSLPYELFADGNINQATNTFEIVLQADNKFFKDKAAGSPFIIYARNYLQQDFTEKNYAVVAGDSLHDVWNIDDFTNKNFHFQILGPNGFYREFKGNNNDPFIQFSLHQNGNTAKLSCVNNSDKSYFITIKDNAYKAGIISKQIDAKTTNTIVSMSLEKSSGWYDFSVTIKNNNLFEKRYSGRLETGKESLSDPAMG